MSEKKQKKLVPKLRFPEFRDSEAWQIKLLSKVCEINPSTENLPEKFIYIDLESVESGKLIKKKTISLDSAPSRAQRLLKSGDIIFQTVRPYQKNNYFFRTDDNYEYVASTGYAQLKANESKMYLYQYLYNDKFVNRVLAKCSGSNYPAINSTDLSQVQVEIPKDPKEQQKIADCLSSIDESISTQTEKLNALKNHKKALMQQLFPAEGETTPQLRFPEFRDRGEWELKRLGVCLKYLQPTEYLVHSTAYDDKFQIPVLTAGKTFILGYTNETEGIFDKECLPVIIFDDFTTASKFVDFPFKVKSSAMKILLAKDNNINIKFIYEAMQRIRYEVGVHERHWISIFSNFHIPIPKLEEQQKIADCLSSIDELITAQTEKIDMLQTHKKGLMQRLFPTADEMGHE